MSKVTPGTLTNAAFKRICLGVYATDDRRFFLEKRGDIGRWSLCERGVLVGYKPSITPAATSQSPLWLRSNSVRAAVAWAKHVINPRDAINARAKES